MSGIAAVPAALWDEDALVLECILPQVSPKSQPLHVVL